MNIKILWDLFFLSTNSFNLISVFHTWWVLLTAIKKELEVAISSVLVKLLNQNTWCEQLKKTIFWHSILIRYANTKLVYWSDFNGFPYIMSSYKEAGLRCPFLLCHEIILEMSSDVMDLSCTATMSQNNWMLLWSILPQWPAVLKG